MGHGVVEQRFPSGMDRSGIGAEPDEKASRITAETPHRTASHAFKI
jgi:hypothetical protein